VPDRALSDALAEALRRIPARATAAPSAAERVADALREQIVDGVLRSGTRLTEETIGAALGYSRNTIREAFALLLAERLAVREPNRGVFVATPTPRDIRDLYATRQLIEPAALEHGPGFSDEALSRLREIVAGARAARERGDTDAVAQGNQEFHRAVVALGGSARLDALMSGVLAEMRLVFHLMDEEGGFHESYLDRNEAIIRDLEAGDRAGAAAALRTYLADAEQHLLAVLGRADSTR
jgi:DNA-binding GntR family transcriptional regulator